MKRQKIKSIYAETTFEQEIHAKGWVRTKREGKKFSFIELNDGSTPQNLQLVIDNTVVNTDILKDISTGACIGVNGLLVKSEGKGQTIEVQVRSIEMYGNAPADVYPLQKKAHTLEFLREIAHLRPRTDTFSCVLRIRASLSYAVHKYFNDKGFFYLNTPIITASDCEGAGEMFAVTTLDLHNVPKVDSKADGNPDFTKDFFGKEAHLTVSGQLEAELAAMALAEVYTFGPTFRAENSNTTRHLAEFWMIEPEMAFYELEDNMELATDFLKYLIKYAQTHNALDLQYLNDHYDDTLLARLDNVVKSDFIRLEYTEAVDILLESGKTFEYKVEWGIDLQSEHERYLVEQHFGRPVIVYNYPKGIKAFYMRLNEDNKTVRAMDVLFPGIGEIIGGSQREERYDVLLSRIREMGLPEENYWWYLDTRKYGSVVHSGFGLGFERLVLFVTGMGNIRDVIPFPRTPGNAEF